MDTSLVALLPIPANQGFLNFFSSHSMPSLLTSSASEITLSEEINLCSVALIFFKKRVALIQSNQ